MGREVASMGRPGQPCGAGEMGRGGTMQLGLWSWTTTKLILGTEGEA
jgi:hypothetical protein